MSQAIVKFVPGTVATVGQGAASLGIKLTKNQAISRVVDFAIRKVVPNLDPKLHQHAKTFLTTAVNDLLRAGQNVTTKVLVSHAKRALPGYLKTITSVPNIMTRFGGRATSMTANSSQQLGGGVALGGNTTYAPVSISKNVRKRSKAKMSMRGDAVVISHSEMLGAVLSGTPTSNVTAYRATGLRANPGISTIFPWLSSMAVNYEKYRFRRLTLNVIPLVSTAFNGRIGVGFDFDSSDAVPGNRQEFYALSTHAESAPWQPSSVSVQCDGIYRFTGTHVAADNKLIDLGQVIVMSDSVSNGGTIAAAIPLYDLIVDYEVELIEPQQALFATQSYSNNSVLVAGVPLGTGVDSTLVVGPSVVSSTTVTATVVTVVLPAGTYAFCTRKNWTAGTPTYTVATPTTGAVLKVDTFAGGSFAASIGTISCTSDVTLTFTITAITYTANMNAFNLLFNRVASGVATNYLS